MKSSRIKRQSLIISALLLISIIYTLIFLHHFNAVVTTGDLAFHLTRIKSLETILKSPINFSVFNHSGQGVNLFYPYLTLLPATVLYKMLHNLIISYIAYIALMTFITLLIAYYCASRFFKTTRGTFFFAIFYTFSAYRATDLFCRTALAEGIALTFLPLVFLGIYNIMTNKANSWQLLAIGLSLVFYTHLLSALICIIFILITLILKLFFSTTNLKQIIFNLIKAAILTLLLTMAFWLPMLEQFLFQSINRPAILNLQNNSLLLGPLVTESLNNNLTYYGFGLFGLISLFSPLFLKRKQFHQIYKIIWYLALIATFVSTRLFPWKLFQNTPINIIQFPWRFMGIQSLFAAILLASIFDNLDGRKKQIRLASFSLSFLLIITISSTVLMYQTIDKRPNSFAINVDNIQTILSNKTSYYTRDYVPTRSIKHYSKVINDYAFINHHWQKIPYTIHNNYFTTQVNYSSKKIILPVYAYKGTTAVVNHKKRTISANKSGLITFHLHANHNYIQIGYQYTRLAILSFLVSLITVLILVIKFIFSKLVS